MVTDNAGPVEIVVPRDREGTFADLDAVVLSLVGQGSGYGEISAHVADVYGVDVNGADVSKDTVTRIRRTS